MADARAAWIAAGSTPEEKAERARSDFLSATDHQGRVSDFHALRSTTATWLAEAGVSPYAMQQIMRHADLAMTSRYTHLSPAVRVAAVGLLDGVSDVGQS